MKPNNLFNSDDRAVSPVIGVILMVAITVILAAVIGTFVLGLGDSLGDNQPSAQLSVDVDEVGDVMTIEHNGGDSIPANELDVVISNVSSGAQERGAVTTRLSVGDTAQSTVSDDTTSFTVNEGFDYRVRIIHTPSESIILDRSFQAQDALEVGDNFEFTA